MCKKLLKPIIFCLILLIIMPSCRRRATCPAYSDTISMEGQAKKEQERQKKEARKRRRKKSRMF